MLKLKCIKCGHEWIARTEKPLKCPMCQSKNWDRKK